MCDLCRQADQRKAALLAELNALVAGLVDKFPVDESHPSFARARRADPNYTLERSNLTRDYDVIIALLACAFRMLARNNDNPEHFMHHVHALLDATAKDLAEFIGGDHMRQAEYVKAMSDGSLRFSVDTAGVAFNGSFPRIVEYVLMQVAAATGNPVMPVKVETVTVAKPKTQDGPGPVLVVPDNAGSVKH